MAQLQSEKYNIAWFNLAEFVMRGEREKAFAIFRLLSYSLKDEALVFQIEGDLFLSFEDFKAVNSYFKAASLYEKSQKYIQAVAIYEHICRLDSNNLNSILALLRLYSTLKNEVKLSKVSLNLSRYLVKNNKLLDLDNILAEIDINIFFLIKIYETVIFDLLKRDYKEKYLYKLIDNILEMYLKLDKKDLNLFLSKISAIDSSLHDYAINSLSK